MYQRKNFPKIAENTVRVQHYNRLYRILINSVLNNSYINLKQQNLLYNELYLNQIKHITF
jgi:hypothetical protein